MPLRIPPLLFTGLLLTQLTACGNLAPSQSPSVSAEEIHPFGTTRIAFHPDGDRLATGGYFGEVKLWGIPGLDARHTLKGNRDPVSALSWAGGWAGGPMIAVGDEAGRLRVHGGENGSLLKQIETGSEVRALAHWGGVLVAGFADGSLVAYARPSLTPVARGEAPGPVRSLAINGPLLAVASEGRRLALYDWELKPHRELPRPPRELLELRFSPDGTRLAGSAWYDWFLWDLESGIMERRDSEHWGAIISLDFTPDGERLLTLGRHTDANLRLVEVDTNQVVRRLEAHRLCGAQVRISPDGRWAATASDDESARLYDLSAPYKPE